MKFIKRILIAAAVFFGIMFVISLFLPDPESYNETPVYHETEENITVSDETLHSKENIQTTKAPVISESEPAATAASAPAKKPVTDIYVSFPDRIIVLEPGEEHEFSVFTDDESLTEDKIIKEFGKNTISVIFKGKEENKLVYIIKAEAPGETELNIINAEEIKLKGSDAEIHTAEIKVLSSYEAQTVYVTAYGERYHFSQRCAGKKSSGIRLYEAQNSGLSPCKKCAH